MVHKSITVLFIFTIFLLTYGNVFAQAGTAPVTGYSSEQYSMDNLNKGLLPEVLPVASVEGELRERIESADTSFFGSIKNAIAGFLLFFVQSENLQTSFIPEEFAAPNEEKAVVQLESFIGEDGYYGVTLPDKFPPEADSVAKPIQIGTFPIPGTEGINQVEQNFENSYMPAQVCTDIGCKEICPITGQCN